MTVCLIIKYPLEEQFILRRKKLRGPANFIEMIWTAVTRELYLICIWCVFS